MTSRMHIKPTHLGHCRLPLVLALVLITTSARPNPISALDRGRLCWHALDLPCAERELTLAYAERDQLAQPLRRELLLLLAELRLSSDAPDAARAHLLELLDLDPAFAPATWPPEWLSVLDEARRLAPDRLPPTLSGALPIEAPPQRPVTVTITATDPSGLSRVELVAADKRFVMSTTDGFTYIVTLPRELLVPGRLPLQIEAWDRHGNGPTQYPSTPHTLTIKPLPDSPALTERWWFWAAIGAAVAGTAVALALALTPTSSSPASSGDLGVILELP